MDCVIDNSAISWLGRIGYLDYLNQIYNNIYGTPGVFRQCRDNNKAIKFRVTILKPLNLDKKQFKRFNKLSGRWKRKLNLDDIVDAELLVANLFYDQGDEILTANIKARHLIEKFVKVRDIAYLYELAENKNIFTRLNSIKYLKKLKNKDYGVKYINNILKILRKSIP